MLSIIRLLGYFGAVLFSVDLVTKRAMLDVARRASSRLFSRILLRDEHGLLAPPFEETWITPTKGPTL